MEKEFIPYEQALELKELGFNEPCFGWFRSTLIPSNFTEFFLETEFGMNESPSDWVNSNFLDKACSAPLYQQAFRWFREKYNLCGEVYTVNMGAIDYTFLIRDLYSEDVKYDNFDANTGGYSGTFNTYEESEIECLKKLIEILKKQKENESNIIV